MAEQQQVREPLRRRLRAGVLETLASACARTPRPLVTAGAGAAARLARWTRFEHIALENLELALGSELSAAERSTIARGVRLHTAAIVADWLRLARCGTPGGPADQHAERGAWIEREVRLDPSVEILERELARGHGALVVTGHIGNWEMLAARLRRTGCDGAVIGYKKPRDSSADFLVDMRRSYGVHTLPQNTHPREILRVLQSGATIGMLSDLEVRRLAGEFLPFFGEPALTVTAPAALARARKIPLIPARCILVNPSAGEERYLLSFDPPLHADRALGRREATLDLTARLNGVYEAWIRETPEQWAWHQRRWRTRPGEAVHKPLAARGLAPPG